MISSLIFIVAIISILVSMLFGMSFELLVVSVMTIIFLIPVIKSFIKNAIFEEPILFVGLSFVFFYSFSSVGYYLRVGTVGNDYIVSTLVVTFGFIMVAISYYYFDYIFKNRLRYKIRVDIGNNRLIIPSISILLVGFYALYASFNVANVNMFSLSSDFLPPALLPGAREKISWNIPLQIAPTYAAMVLFMVGFKKNNRLIKLLSIAAYLLSLFFLFRLGSRSRILISFISVIAIYHYFYKKITRIKLIIISIAIFVFLVIYGNFRSVIFTDRRENAYSAFGEFSANEYIMQHGDSVVFKATIDIMNSFPEQYGFLWGSTVITPLTNYIPRVIWPEKPSSAAAIYTAYFYPDFAETGGTSTTGFIGELYMNGGLVFVIIGSLVLGVILRKIKMLGAGNDAEKFIYLNILTPLLVVARGDIAFVFGMIINCIIIYAFIFLLGGGKIAK